jgi:hypothetical protein
MRKLRAPEVLGSRIQKSKSPSITKAGRQTAKKFLFMLLLEFKDDL